LERIGEVDEMVSVPNVRMGNNVGQPCRPGSGRLPGPRRVRGRMPECWEWRTC